MDALDTGAVQGRDVGRLSSILRFSTVVDFKVAMERELKLGGNRMAVLEKEFTNVIFYGEATRLLLVFPTQIDSCKFGAGPIFGDDIIFLEDILKLMGVVFPKIFNTKVIYDEIESDRAPFVAPEDRGGECFVVAISI